MSRKMRIQPPAQDFRQRIETCLNGFARLNVSQQEKSNFCEWMKRFLQGEGLNDLWTLNGTEIKIRRGRKEGWVKRYPVTPEDVLESLASDKLAFLDLPGILKTKRQGLPKEAKEVLMLTARREKKRAAANLDRSAKHIERYARTLKLFNRGTDFGSKELAEAVRSYGRKISELPSSRGRRQEIFLKLSGIQLMKLLNDNKYHPPWTLAGRLMHDAFAPDPWTTARESSGRALKQLIKEDVTALRKGLGRNAPIAP